MQRCMYAVFANRRIRKGKTMYIDKVLLIVMLIVVILALASAVAVILQDATNQIISALTAAAA